MFLLPLCAFHQNIFESERKLRAALLMQVCFEPENGHYLVTASFDKLAKVWSSKDFRLLRKLAGHEGHVACCDVSPDGSNTIVTVSQDRSIKLWAPDADFEIKDEVKMEL